MAGQTPTLFISRMVWFEYKYTPFAAQIRRVLTHFGTSESFVVKLQS